MADKKISELNAASTLVGTELLPVVQDGETKKTAVTTLSSAVEDYLISIGAISDFGPARLFASGEQGTWYDPSDFSSMYQDSAGTTPVTAVEQPVGKILDKSGNGNHASQSTTASRPILRNLYNLLTYTDQFDNAAWSKLNCTAATTTATTDPIGGTTADVLTETEATNYKYISQATVAIAVNSQTQTFSAYVKDNGCRWIRFDVYEGSSAANIYYAVFDLQNGVTGLTGKFGSSNGSYVSSSITSMGNGWYKCALTYTTGSGASGGIAHNGTIFLLRGVGNVAPNAGFTNSVYAGNGISGIYIWGASLVPANEASIPYQRVVTNAIGSGVYDSDVTKFPPYLYFDGTDDFLVTGNIDFSATDKMSVFAGVGKLSASTAIMCELSANANTYTGSFYLLFSGTGYACQVRGTATNNKSFGTYTSPITSVISCLISSVATNSSEAMSMRFNAVPNTGTSAVSNNSTGKFGTYPLYIGRRSDTSFPCNGRIYSLITRGALTTTPQLEKTERWVATKTGVTL